MLTACEEYSDWELSWVVIWVTNDSSNKIDIRIDRKHFGESYHDQWETNELNTSIEPGKDMRFEGESGHYLITITNFESNQFHYPKGGTGFIPMWGKEFLEFDGTAFNYLRREVD